MLYAHIFIQHGRKSVRVFEVTENGKKNTACETRGGGIALSHRNHHHHHHQPTQPQPSTTTTAIAVDNTKASQEFDPNALIIQACFHERSNATGSQAGRHTGRQQCLRLAVDTAIVVGVVSVFLVLVVAVVVVVGVVDVMSLLCVFDEQSALGLLGACSTSGL